MELFKNYQTDIDIAADEADNNIGALIGLTGDDLLRKQSEIETALSEANQVISSMTVSVSHFGNKQTADNIIEKCKSRLKELNKRYRTANEQAKGKNDRLNLLGATDAESLASVQARTAILSDTEVLRQGEDELRHINQRVNSIGAQGADTLDTMHQQRERMEGQRSRLDGIRMKLRDSERLIRAIGARMSVNDFMKLGIMVFIVILIIIIIYLRWIRKNVKTAPPTAPVGFEPYNPIAPAPTDVFF